MVIIFFQCVNTKFLAQQIYSTPLSIILHTTLKKNIIFWTSGGHTKNKFRESTLISSDGCVNVHCHYHHHRMQCKEQVKIYLYVNSSNYPSVQIFVFSYIPSAQCSSVCSEKSRIELSSFGYSSSVSDLIDQKGVLYFGVPPNQ